jgi:hypothetical protein
MLKPVPNREGEDRKPSGSAFTGELMAYRETSACWKRTESEPLTYSLLVLSR